AGTARVGRDHLPGRRDHPPPGRGPAGHPQRGPPAEAVAGTAPPGSAPQVLVLLLLRPPRVARSRRARQPLAFLPALPARRPPGLHAGANRPLHRGLVAAGRGHRDDRLLPVLGADPAQEGRGADSPGQGAHPGHLGRTRSLSRPRTRRARARRRPQPGPRRAPARRLALGASRRGRARFPTAHRLLRPGPARQVMTQAYSTLRVAPADDGVLGVVMDAPPMNLIGPELVRDLVSLLGELESGQETRVVV